jgi:ParB family chromosome partitioning protein
MLIAIDAITIGPGHRPGNKQAIKEITASIELIGLKTPISVMPARSAGKYLLVAGRHRLEACRRLGWGEIEANLVTDGFDADLWEVAENLHRRELTAMQRNVAVGKWVRLAAKKLKRNQRDIRTNVGPKSKGRPVGAGSIRAAAQVLNIPRTTAARAVYIAENLTKSAQQEAEKLGLDNNQRALERAAGVPGAEEQVRALHRTVAEQQGRKEAKARIAENLAAVGKPKTAQAAFDAWYWSLEIDMRMEVSIWLLGLDTEAYVAELRKTDELLRGDQQALH